MRLKNSRLVNSLIRQQSLNYNISDIDTTANTVIPFMNGSPFKFRYVIFAGETVGTFLSAVWWHKWSSLKIYVMKK